MKRIKFVGLDVHAETIAVAVAEQDGEIRSLGVIPNREDSVRKLVRKLGAVEELRFCYEAGPTGYVLYWQLSKLGAKCEVVAPTLVPVKAGDRVKTDRRDALKLARNYRAGELTPVWVPDAAHEALRDVVRAREAAKKDQLRARHRLGKFLLRQGRRPPTGVKVWTLKYLEWVKREVHFEQMAQEDTLLDYLHEVEHAAARIARLDGAIERAVKCAPPRMRAVIDALQALRGIAHVSAVTVVAELGELSRFSRASQLMGYAGLGPAKTPVGSARDEALSPRRAMRIYDESLWRPPGPTVTDRRWGRACESDKSLSGKRSKRSLGKHSIGYMSAIGSCWPEAKTREC